MPYYEYIPTDPYMPIKDIYTPNEAAVLLRMSRGKLFQLAKRSDDPLPLRRLDSCQRGTLVFRDELLSWAKRNYKLLSPR